MKKFIIELSVILVLSITISVAYNHFQESSLPFFKKYQPNPALAAGEDLTVYYHDMDVETLRSLLEADMVVLLDARSVSDYNKGYIPRAVSFPIGEFKRTYPKVAELLADAGNQGKSIVIYCIGVHCLDSSLLAKELHNKGHREIFVYKGGIEEWQELGYPIKMESSPSTTQTERENFK
jgi:3-mercaptopyruvate sulfurtransferase SseA